MLALQPVAVLMVLEVLTIEDTSVVIAEANEEVLVTDVSLIFHAGSFAVIPFVCIHASMYV